MRSGGRTGSEQCLREVAVCRPGTSVPGTRKCDGEDGGRGHGKEGWEHNSEALCVMEGGTKGVAAATFWTKGVGTGKANGGVGEGSRGGGGGG